MSPRSATAKAGTFTDGATLESAKANAVKMTPGHGKAGRHPTRAMLDALSGNKDPGMFGRMFPMLSPLEVSDAKLRSARERYDRRNPGDRSSAITLTSRRASPISGSSSTTTSPSI